MPTIEGKHNMNLTEKTRELLQTRPRTKTYADIALATGIGKSWLRTFGRGEMKEPSAVKIQALHEYLSGRKLEA